jgi:hypothetical protein
MQQSLEHSAHSRTPSVIDIAQAVAGLARALDALPPERHGDITPALRLLTEMMARDDISPTRPSRFVELYNKLSEHDSGERKRAICERLGFEKSTYYRRLAEAQEAGLIEVPKASQNSHE